MNRYTEADRLLRLIGRNNFTIKEIKPIETSENPENPFTNFRKNMGYSRLMMDGLIKEVGGRVMLTKLGKKYHRKGYSKYIDNRNNKKKFKAFFSKYQAIFYVLLGMGLTILWDIIKHILGF